MTTSEQTPLAVVGMACRLPGANDLAAYWRLLVEGRSALSEWPASRLDQNLYFDPQPGQRGKTYCRLGGVCDYTLRSDLLTAEIRARSDLAHLAGCDVAIAACEQAGWDPRRLPRASIGVFLGHTRGSELSGDLAYAALVGAASKWLHEIPEFAALPGAEALRAALVRRIRSQLPRRRAGGLPDAASHRAAALIAEVLGLSGPAIVLNAACSSSLLALAFARRMLEQGRVDAALVGGTTYCKWDNLILYSHARSASANGSRPFDAEADGLIASDGYAILLVKTLERALAEGDPIQAVIRGIGISSDGRGKSLWAPRKEGQLLAMQRAYAGGLDPARLQFVEAHATSTQVGDATEMNALAEFLLPHRRTAAPIPVASVKANIGHTLEAAGAASLIKTILALQHGLIPAQIHCRTLNPEIDWQHAPFFVPLQNTPWPAAAAGAPRCAAVNAFGIGGLNAHVLLEEFLPPRPRAVTVPATSLGLESAWAAPLTDDLPRRPQPIAIVGASCHFAGAASPAALAELLAADRSALGPLPASRAALDDLRDLVAECGSTLALSELTGGVLTGFEYDWRRHKIPPIQVARANPLQFLVLAAVEEALADARCDLARLDRQRIGVVVGTQFASDFVHQLQLGLRLPEFQRDLAIELARAGANDDQVRRIASRYADILLGHFPALLDESGSFSTSTLASRVAKTYDLMGGAVALDGGASASEAALAAAIDNLVDGQVDLMICAAAQRWLDLVLYQIRALAGRFPHETPGEGVGAVILKRLADAQRDGDRVLAVLHVGAVPAPGRHEPLPRAALTPAIGDTLGAAGLAALLASLPAPPANLPPPEFLLDRELHIWSSLPAARAATTAARPAIVAQPPHPDGECSRDLARRFPELLLLDGSPYEMGLAHGRACRDAIRRVLHHYADTVGQSWDRLPGIDQAAAEPELYLGADELAEMEGLAAGAGVAPQAIIAHNLRLYPDMGSGCVQFAFRAVSSTRSGLLHAANEDRPAGLMVRGALARTIQVRRPAGGIPYAVFGVTGEVGGINGTNARGLTVTSAMLLDLPRRPETARGKLHVVLVSRILSRAATIAEALEIARDHHGTSAWGLCVSHAGSGDVCYLEYDGQRLQHRLIDRALVAANHSRLFEPIAEVPAHSRHRLARLEQLLASAAADGCSLEQAQAALRDRFDAARGRPTRHATMNTIRRVDNQVSLVFESAAARVWTTRGPASEPAEDEFHCLPLETLWSAERTPAASIAHQPLSDAPRAVAGPPTKPPVPPPPTAAAASSTAQAPRVCQRYVLRTRSADRAPCAPRPLAGTAIVLGNSALARALADRLKARGTAAIALTDVADSSRVLAQLAEACRGERPVHLFLATPHDGAHRAAVPLDVWPARRRAGVVTPFLVCQQWYTHLAAAGRLGQSSLTAVAALGGQFAFGGIAASRGPIRLLSAAESGALAGLVKAVWFETGMSGPGLAAKVIDLDPAEPPAQLVDYVLEELDRGQPEVEIGYAQGRRYVVRPQPVDLPPPADLAPADLAASGPRPGEVWLITGGARGVTAKVALALGRRFGLRLHLVGTSPRPTIDPAWRTLSPEQLRELKARITREALAEGKIPAQVWQHVERAIEIDRNLHALAEAGVAAAYHACDVANREALADLLARIRAADGPIAGIVHGAGFEHSCRFEKKSPELLERTLQAKVDGAMNLVALTAADPLRYFLAFGSISGRFGNFGQTDYSLANEMLSKLVAALPALRPGLRAATFQWHSWADVGMAVRPESAFGKKRKNMRFMPTAEGTYHLLGELLAGLPEPEVLITDPDYFRTFYPLPVARRQ